MSNYKQLYPPVRTCQSETEICNLFERHMKVLSDQKRKMINEITEWENNLIRQIQENVNKQKVLLEQECKNQVHYLQTKRQEFLDTALIYEGRKNREEVRQLIEQCHALKFELDSFEYPEQPIPFIQIQKEKQPVGLNQHSSNIRKFEKKPMMNNDFRIEDNRNAPTSTYSQSTFASSNQINQQLLTTLSPVNNDRYIATGNDKLTFSNVIINDDMVEKCPACSMIFPSTMGTNERSQHVNEHFGDN